MTHYFIQACPNEVTLEAIIQDITEDGNLVFMNDDDKVIAVFKDWAYFYEIDPPDEDD